MNGALFVVPCPGCASAMRVVVRDTVVCSQCGCSYLVKFGYLIPCSQTERPVARRGVAAVHSIAKGARA